MKHIDKYQHAGLTVKIFHDMDCESPLENDAGLHITYSKRSRYTLGNDALEQEEHEAIAKRIDSGELIGLRVFAYIHSGVALSTSSAGQFSDQWDAGQSGFVYVDRKTALEWQGGKILTKKKRDAALKSLASCVEEFGRYCNGECYGYAIEDEDGNDLESCWGFIGFEYVKEEAESQADWHAKDQRENKRKAWRAALHEARERRYWLQRGVVTV